MFYDSKRFWIVMGILVTAVLIGILVSELATS